MENDAKIVLGTGILTIILILSMCYYYLSPEPMDPKYAEIFVYVTLIFIVICPIFFVLLGNYNRKTGGNNILTKVGLIPRYTEISLYLTALTFLLVALTNKEIIDAIGTVLIFNETLDIGGFLVIFSFFIGLAFSLYYAFSDKKTPVLAKQLILYFVIITNIVVAGAAGYHIIFTQDTKDFFLIIFPIMNLVYALIIMLFARVGIIDESSMPDENTSQHEVIVGTVSVIILFLFSQFILKNYWAITFSLCLVYSSMINGIVTKALFRK